MMKRKTLVGLIAMAGFFCLLLFSFESQVGGYMSFAQAVESQARAHVIGDWVARDETRYDPAQNLFSFFMRDEEGAVRQVHYYDVKPATFEDAEQVVVQGRIEGDIFVAEDILIKCPSKYNDARALQGEAETPSHL